MINISKYLGIPQRMSHTAAEILD